MNTYTHIGLDFVDHEGERITNVSLVNRDTGKAIGICDWKGESVTRIIAIDSVDANTFFKEARTLRDNSIPLRFTNTTSETPQL